MCVRSASTSLCGGCGVNSHPYRDSGLIQGLLALRRAAAGSENLMPLIFDAVKAYATLGEICEAMRVVFGTYEEIAIT